MPPPPEPADLQRRDELRLLGSTTLAASAASMWAVSRSGAPSLNAASIR